MEGSVYPSCSYCHLLDNCLILKTLGLYLYILIIGHKYCNKLSLQNKLTLQKKLQHFVTNRVFLTKKHKQRYMCDHRVN